MNKYIWGALVAVLGVVISYVGYFYFGLEMDFSDSPQEWSGFGDYFGGLLNPLLSFVALVLLIKSLEAQRKANDCLTSQIDNSEQSEKLRRFENLFFGLIGSQREIYKDLKLNVKIHHTNHELSAENALFVMDARIEFLRSQNTISMIKEYVAEIDSNDRIYSLIRAFSLTVRLISERLADKENFSVKERKEYFKTLINLTEFTHFRLVLIGLIYLECYPSEYLRSNSEFKEILDELGFNLDQMI
nr:hypothetical protein [Acinetobacter sp.]